MSEYDSLIAESLDVVVVGAGPGGLATAALLTRVGIRCVLLDRGAVGQKWRSAYDRLRINTSTLTSHLPRMRFPLRVGLWASRDDLIEYYEAYAERFGVDIRGGVEATGVERWAEGWRVHTSSEELEARAVVLATGRDCTPVFPDWPGRQTFAGTCLHASRYRNASPYKGARAVVVGVGNSGADIAVDLLRGGARSVAVALRTPPHILSRSVFGVPNDVLMVLSRCVPNVVADAAAELVRRWKYGDLEAKGLRRPPTGVKTYVKTQARVPTIDAGPFTSAVRDGGICIVGAVDALDGDTVVLKDGARVGADLVVAATGYRPCLEPLIGHLGVLDDRGWPWWAPATNHIRLPGLYVLGFGDPTRGNLRGLRLDASSVATTIRRQLR